MSKTFNREQAKLWAAERRQHEIEASHRRAVREEMAVLRQFRDYFLPRWRGKLTETDPLIAAIDQRAGELTGDPTALHAKNTGHPQPWWQKE